MIVTDASVVLCAVIDNGADGIACRRRLSTQHVVVPDGLDLRVLHGLSRLVRAGRLRESRAQQAIHDLRDLPLQRVPQAPFLTRAWQLRDHLPALHAMTIAVAEAYAVPLVTADRTYARSLDATCPIELL